MLNSNFFKNGAPPSYSRKEMLEEMAEQAYLAYCIQLEYRDENGNQLKSWKFLSGDVRDAWINASLFVLRHYQIQKS